MHIMMTLFMCACVGATLYAEHDTLWLVVFACGVVNAAVHYAGAKFDSRQLIRLRMFGQAILSIAIIAWLCTFIVTVFQTSKVASEVSPMPEIKFVVDVGQEAYVDDKFLPLLPNRGDMLYAESSWNGCTLVRLKNPASAFRVVLRDSKPYWFAAAPHATLLLGSDYINVVSFQPAMFFLIFLSFGMLVYVSAVGVLLLTWVDEPSD